MKIRRRAEKAPLFETEVGVRRPGGPAGRGQRRLPRLRRAAGRRDGGAGPLAPRAAAARGGLRRRSDEASPNAPVRRNRRKFKWLVMHRRALLLAALPPGE